MNAFLLFHIAAIFCWCIPAPSPLLSALREAISPYMLWSGLFQSWDTFAPAPKASNTRLEGVVIARDGHLSRYHFPQMQELSLFDRYVKERYRKFAETLPVESNSEAWADVAQHLARSYGDPANPPEIVMLVKYSSDIVLAGQHTAPYARVFFQTKFAEASE